MPFFKSEDDLDLFYTDEGAGLPVIGLAGLTRNTADFDHVAPHLPVRLIRMDYRALLAGSYNSDDRPIPTDHARDSPCG